MSWTIKACGRKQNGQAHVIELSYAYVRNATEMRRVPAIDARVVINRAMSRVLDISELLCSQVVYIGKFPYHVENVSDKLCTRIESFLWHHRLELIELWEAFSLQNEALATFQAWASHGQYVTSRPCLMKRVV